MNRRSAKVDLVASAIASSDNGVGHYGLASKRPSLASTELQRVLTVSTL
jgi:hypothetical protein